MGLHHSGGTRTGCSCPLQPTSQWRFLLDMNRYEQIRAIHYRQNSYTTYLDCMLISLSTVAMGLQHSGGTRTGCSCPLQPTLKRRFLLDMNRYEHISAIHNRQNSYTTYLDCMLISLSRVAMAPFGSFIDVHSRDNNLLSNVSMSSLQNSSLLLWLLCKIWRRDDYVTVSCS